MIKLKNFKNNLYIGRTSTERHLMFSCYVKLYNSDLYQQVAFRAMYDKNIPLRYIYLNASKVILSDMFKCILLSEPTLFYSDGTGQGRPVGPLKNSQILGEDRKRILTPEQIKELAKELLIK